MVQRKISFKSNPVTFMQAVLPISNYEMGKTPTTLQVNDDTIQRIDRAKKGEVYP